MRGGRPRRECARPLTAHTTLRTTVPSWLRSNRAACASWNVFGAASVCIGWAGGTYEFFRWYLRIEDDWSVHTRAAGRGPMGCGPMG